MKVCLWYVSNASHVFDSSSFSLVVEMWDVLFVIWLEKFGEILFCDLS